MFVRLCLITFLCYFRYPHPTPAMHSAETSHCNSLQLTHQYWAIQRDPWPFTFVLWEVSCSKLQQVAASSQKSVCSVRTVIHIEPSKEISGHWSFDSERRSLCVNVRVCVCVCVYLHTHGDRLRYASIIYDTTHYRMTRRIYQWHDSNRCSLQLHTPVACNVLVVLQSVSTH